MKKYLFFMWLLLLFIPTIIFADTCDSSAVKVESIELLQKSGLAKETAKPNIVGKSVALNLEMSFKGDFVRYAITIHNGSEEDYVIDKSMISNIKDYFNYTFDADDGYVKAGASKRIILRVEYTDGIPENKFVNNVFEYNDSVMLNLNGSKVDENPATGVKSLLYLIPIIFIIGVVFLTLNKKNKAFKVMVLFMFILIPTIVYAVCKCELNIESTIKVNKCTFKLVTDIGSFSKTEDVKELCVSDGFDDYEYTHSYAPMSYTYRVNNTYKPILEIDPSKITSSSYIRAYEDNTKTNLLKEYTSEELSSLFTTRKYSISYLTRVPYNRHTIILPDATTYVEYSDDIRSSGSVRLNYTRYVVERTIDGLWTNDPDIFNALNILDSTVNKCHISFYSNTIKSEQDNVFDTSLGSFKDEDNITNVLALAAISDCPDKYLVGFTNCDDITSENYQEVLDTNKSLKCSGNIYHALWYKYDDK